MHKERPRLAARLLLESALSGDDVRGLRLDPTNETLGLCDVAVANGMCGCCRRVFATLQQRQNESPHVHLVDFFSKVLPRAECPALQRHGADVVRTVAAIVFSRRATWGQQMDANDPDLLLRGPSGKRRRTDPHVVDTAVHCAVAGASVTAPSSSSTAVTDRVARYHRSKKLCSLLAQNVLSCSSARVVSSAVDAGRVGRPAVEVNLHEAMAVLEQQAVPLAPTVPMMHRTRFLDITDVCIRGVFLTQDNKGGWRR